MMWVAPGDEVLVERHALQMLGQREACAREEDLLAVVCYDVDEREMLEPMGEWCLIEPDPWRRETTGGLALPEESQHRPRSGIFLACGPGRLRQGNALAGTRKTVAAIVNLPGTCQLQKRRVYFDARAKVMEVGCASVAYTLVRASDLIAVEMTDEEEYRA